jgi:hypothetical protein
MSWLEMSSSMILSSLSFPGAGLKDNVLHQRTSIFLSKRVANGSSKYEYQYGQYGF